MIRASEALELQMRNKTSEQSEQLKGVFAAIFRILSFGDMYDKHEYTYIIHDQKYRLTKEDVKILENLGYTVEVEFGNHKISWNK